MHLIEFTSALVAIATDGSIILALFDGETEVSPRRCVAILKSRRDAAESLSQSIGSTLKNS